MASGITISLEMMKEFFLADTFDLFIIEWFMTAVFYSSKFAKECL